ncbi:MAG TPA: CAP domain-containing protein [Longimicrobiales bacterium]
MKQRSTAMLLALAAVWSCALQPAAGPRTRPEPQVQVEDGGTPGAAGADAAPDSASVGAERALAVAPAVPAGGSTGQAAAAEEPGDGERAASWVDPEIDLEYLALRVLAEANAVRMRAGSRPLVMDAALRRAARRYSRELAERQEIEHLSPTPGRRTFRQRIAAEGARARIAGENLARLSASVESLPSRAVRAWMKSPGHRRNLLDPIFSRTGIGVMLGRDGIWYVVQVYATPS